jgi:hypothetical protein
VEENKQLREAQTKLAEKNEEIASLKWLLDDRDRELKRLQKDNMANDQRGAIIIESLRKTFEDSDKRHADSVKSLQKTFEGRMNSPSASTSSSHRPPRPSAPRINPGYVNIVATTVIDAAKGSVGRLTCRKRPSAADISPPAKRPHVGDHDDYDVVLPTMTEDKDYDGVVYDTVDTNNNTTLSAAPSTAPSAEPTPRRRNYLL